MKRSLLTTLQVTLILILFAAIAHAELYCHLCGRKIAGTYYRSTGGELYCDACWTSHTQCSQCGKLVQKTTTVDGMKLCGDCYARLDLCGLCGKPLAGNYMDYPKLGLKVCSQCERDKARCQKCGVPLNEAVKVGGALVCSRCAGNIERCRSCGNALLKDYTFFEDNKDAKYCSACVANYPRCDDCGAPSGPDGTKLEDGRHLCPDCRRIAYFDPELVSSIRKKIQSFIAADMSMKIDHDINFSIKDQAFLKAKDKNIHGDINGLFYRKGSRFDIFVLYGLREKDLISVIAHELTHAWQAEKCPRNITLENQEGFAQWIAFKALNSFGYSDFANLMTEGDNIYARGLNKMLKLESRNGPNAVFAFIRTAK